METLHQVTIIACINGSYRTLTMARQPALSAETAVERCYHTISILESASNRIQIKAELKAAERHEEEYWSHPDVLRPDVNKPMPRSRFPFVMTCMILGATYGLIDSSINNTRINADNMVFNEKIGDRVGVTVYDITEPSRVRCCFVNRHFPCSAGGIEPLSAYDYIAFGYGSGEKVSRVRAALQLRIEQFPRFNLIPIAVLRKLWPKECWTGMNEFEKRETLEAEGVESIRMAICDKPKGLRDCAMNQLLQEIVEYPDPEVEEVAGKLTDYKPRQKEMLYNRAEDLRPSSERLRLLLTTLRDEAYVDLSPFHSFTCEDISLLVSQLQDHGQMRRLNLSNMPNLTNEGLSRILSSSKKQVLQALYLMENPQISLKTLCTLRYAGDIFHSELLGRSITDYEKDMRGLERWKPPRRPMSSLDFPVRDNAVIQVIWIGMTSEQMRFHKTDEHVGSSCWGALSADPDIPRYNLVRLGTRLDYNVFPLMDVPLSTIRLVTGFWNLLKWCSNTCVSNAWSFSTAAACSFATGSLSSSSYPDTPTNGVGPLSTELYLGNHNIHILEDREKVFRLYHLKPDQWAFIMIQESCDASFGKRQIGYALVSPTDGCSLSTSNKVFQVADIPSYLELIAKTDPNVVEQARELRAWWKKNINQVKDVSFYKKYDIKYILERVYGADNSASSSRRTELQSIIFL